MAIRAIHPLVRLAVVNVHAAGQREFEIGNSRARGARNIVLAPAFLICNGHRKVVRSG